MTALTGLGTVTSGSLEWTIAFMFACGFFSASYNGPIYSVIVTIAGAKLRGLAVSMVQLGAHLIGVGAGTFLIGAISDYVGGVQGIDWGHGVAKLFNNLERVVWGRS